MKKKILLIIALIAIIGAFFAYNFYTKIYNSNTTKEGFVFIKTGSNFDELKKELKPFVKNINSFIWVAKKKKFTKIKPGRYKISKQMTNNDLVNMLRSGKQVPLKLAFNNQNTLENLSGRIASQIETDSISLLKTFTDEQFLNKIKFTKAEALGVFIPNSYQVNWNISAIEFRDKMFKEYRKFWSASRLAKAKKLNLSPKEIMTVASIVQKETAKSGERPIVAGLYLNRLRDKWPLQADPTIIYAMKQKYGQDFEMRRVLFKNIEDIKDSPYNTYKKQGLPPSLIAMPDISAIDAVLNAKNHDYYFMCASVSKIGYHEFAKTLSQHNVNRKKFIAKKNKQGIRQ
jgi:UPF0755 protein